MTWTAALAGLLDRLRSRSEPPAHAVPDGRRVYCVGDIHGRADLLEALHGMIRADAGDFGGERCIVYLGDYVDRGEASREVIDALLEQPLDGFEAVHLRGNHEQALLDFLKYPEETASWLTYGGLATLLSYGVRLERAPFSGDMAHIAEQFAERLPEPHLAFLESLPLSHTEGDYAFVHAGVRPGVPLEQQQAEDLLWIREPFIGSRSAHDYCVVHGHSISDEVEMRPNRIGIDTGAFVSGVLSCLVLEGETRRLLQTKP